MSADVLSEGTLDAHREQLCIALRQSLLLTLVVCIYASAAQADDRPLHTDRSLVREAPYFQSHELGAASKLSAPVASLTPSNDFQEFSATEFRPRKRNSLELESGMSRGPLLDAPMLNSNSVFQHMSDFKSQGRVRLLTLWQMRGSSLSLQAGKHGSPSLQWSTPWVRNASASRGLFDRLLPLPQNAFGTRGNLPHLTLSAPTQSRTLEPASGSNIK